MNEQHVSPTPSIAVVGAGPRGTSLLERIGAHLSADHGNKAPDRGFAAGLDLHVIDDAPHGPGRIWRTDQPRDLCMNTLAHAVTLFTEPGATITGPVREGPTLYEWAIHARDAAAGAPAYFGALLEHPVRAGFAEEYADELAAMRPESHPSRALYGEYLAWCFDRALSLLPAWVRVTRYLARVIDITRATTFTGDPGELGAPVDLDVPGDLVGLGELTKPDVSREGYSMERERLTLDDGSTVIADAVILATGWLPTAKTRAEQTLEEQLNASASSPAAGSAWVQPASPIEQDLSNIASGELVIVRGLGMSFFDMLSLLTLGRGGQFIEDQAAPGGLRYIASGAEPVVHVTSRRGVPFRSKSLYGGLPPKPAQRFLRGIDWAREPRPINFDRRLWPRIVADAFLDHALTLERVRPGSVSAPNKLEAALAQAVIEREAQLGADSVAAGESTDGAGAATTALLTTIGSIAEVVARFITDETLRFDLAGETAPVRERFASPKEFEAWVRSRVAHDLDEAELGVDSPFKAGLWSISAARAVASRIGTLGGFDAESRVSGFKLLFEIGGIVGSGPPAFRNRQLLALNAAGLVRFIGPAATVTVDADRPTNRFATESPLVARSRIEANTLVDAWMHFHSLEQSADPVALGLLRAGRARSFHVKSRAVGSASSSAPGTVSTGGFDVDPASGRIVHADGTLDAAVHVAGIPADQTLHDTVISPMPGTDPPLLRETDRVARSAIRIARHSRPTPVLPLAASREGVLHA